jgi:hypothetical protein
MSEAAARAGTRSLTAAKLARAAALAAVLVPLGHVAAEADTISCNTSSGSGNGLCSGTGFYSGGAGLTTNIWQFFDGDDNLLYTLKIQGEPDSDFELNVNDVVTTQGTLEEDGDLANFGNATCIPTFDENSCGLFNVTVVSGEASWVDGYLLYITWFAFFDSMKPPDDGNNTILQAKDGGTGTGTVFTNELADIDYDLLVDPDNPFDPGIGGRGDAFSLFGPFRIPEPGSLLLFGVGIGAVLRRARRRKG